MYSISRSRELCAPPSREPSAWEPLQVGLRAAALPPLLALPLWVALWLPTCAGVGLQALLIYPLWPCFGAVAGVICAPARLACRLPDLFRL